MTKEQRKLSRPKLTATREQIFPLFIKLMHQIETDDEERHAQMKKKMTKIPATVWVGMTVTMLHVLDIIGQYEPVNGITVAKQLAITKGGVTKITKKLLEKQLLLRETHPTNKKEVYFRLTPEGKELALVHQQLHRELEKQSLQFLDKYQDNELEVIVRFLEDLIKYSDDATSIED